ncbi:Cytochrome c oxidase polypeptide I+III [Frankliniella fusca]|uniref:Cytochrome c oxidase polypeptide I+III n=1 Tax=Frankliniella fusca TaxID=407009 RepID=A0AAE1LK82_9NEOP|nr:Cytochrome c oxidase polypeptide I+III [Frankliniella fusca]
MPMFWLLQNDYPHPVAHATIIGIMSGSSNGAFLMSVGLIPSGTTFVQLTIVACIYLPTPASLLEVVHLPLSLEDLEQC